MHIALAFNPSHLEIVAPVVEGSVRARQDRRGDAQRDQVVPVIIHGDAAFAGQGVVMETFQMSQTRGFCTGGTDPHRDEQPGRLHHQPPRGCALDRVLHRRREDGAGADFPRER
jgi:hypothetical protein